MIFPPLKYGSNGGIFYIEAKEDTMKRGEIVTGKVERTDYPSKGIVRVDSDNTLSVKNVLPGQTVSVRVKKVRGGKGEGSLIDVIKPADNEITPPCESFGICGGCAYMNLSYEDQLKLKEGQVLKLIKSVRGLEDIDDGRWQGIKGSPAHLGYRNKMEYTFGDEYKDGPLSLGLHKRGSFYDVVSAGGCKICDEDYGLIVNETLDFFKEKGISYYHRLRHEGYLRHLMVRKAFHTDEIMVAIVTTTQLDFDMEQYKDMLLGLSDKLKGKIVSVIHTLNDSLADIVQSDKSIVLYGRDYITEKMLGMEFRISEFSFFQTNTRGAELLYETARDYIGDIGKGEAVVYDLYSGTGTIAQMMAPVAKKVYGVEIVKEAVEAAKENAKLNGLDNCEFIAGDVLKVLEEATAGGADSSTCGAAGSEAVGISEAPDFIILDPPRDGIHPKALRKIIDYGVERLIYISCKPTSLVRDLETFLAHGYDVVKAVAIEQFPNTSHVETVVLLTQRKPDMSIEITMDEKDLELTRAEAKATYKQITDYVQNRYGLHVPNLYVAQVKREFGIIERENYNKGKEGHPIPQVTPEKREAIIDALRFYKMIN